MIRTSYHNRRVYGFSENTKYKKIPMLHLQVSPGITSGGILSALPPKSFLKHLILLGLGLLQSQSLPGTGLQISAFNPVSAKSFHQLENEFLSFRNPTNQQSLSGHL